MLKRLMYIFMILALLSGCTGETKDKTKAPTVLLPEMLLSLEDVKALVSYEPVLSGENTRAKSKVYYSTDPIGGSDPVILELHSYQNGQNVTAVYEQFSTKKKMRPKSENVPDLGMEAFIAYPTINLYKDGFFIVITAGSGSGDEQKNLLINAAKTAAAHLNEYLKTNPTNSDLLSDTEK